MSRLDENDWRRPGGFSGWARLQAGSTQNQTGWEPAEVERCLADMLSRGFFDDSNLESLVWLLGLPTLSDRFREALTSFVRESGIRSERDLPPRARSSVLTLG